MRLFSLIAGFQQASLDSSSKFISRSPTVHARNDVLEWFTNWYLEMKILDAAFILIY